MAKKITFLSLIALSMVQAASADTFDFGGKPERFKGRGDRVPPTCQVTAPAAAGKPFKIEWNCEDDDTQYGDIRSELWVLRPGALRWELVKSYLGFPAGLSIDTEVLKTATVAEGLPASFRVLGIDRAGNTTFSPVLAVQPGSAETFTCSLNVVVGGTETSDTGEVTGVPTQTVSVLDAEAEILTSSATAFSLSTLSKGAVASPCEVDSLCEQNATIAFSGTGTSDGTTATVELSVLPGTLAASLTGTATLSSEGAFTAVSVSGETTLDEQPATVTLDCSSVDAGVDTGSGVDTGTIDESIPVDTTTEF